VFYGNSPLNVAACRVDLPTMRMLIESGADVHTTNDAGATPLHRIMFCTIEQRHFMEKAVDLLVKTGAQVNFAAVHSLDTPLHWAARTGNEEGVRALMKFGADVKLTNCEGLTPFQVAEKKEHVGTAAALVGLPHKEYRAYEPNFWRKYGTGVM
jgi:ankyrin repeat protein